MPASVPAAATACCLIMHDGVPIRCAWAPVPLCMLPPAVLLPCRAFPPPLLHTQRCTCSPPPPVSPLERDAPVPCAPAPPLQMRSPTGAQPPVLRSTALPQERPASSPALQTRAPYGCGSLAAALESSSWRSLATAPRCRPACESSHASGMWGGRRGMPRGVLLCRLRPHCLASIRTD